MAFSVGIIGLPNVGKSTLFKALTRQKVEIANYPFTTINPNVGVVPVPDERLEKIAQIIKPEKITPTTIEFIDIAGLVKDAHKGEGLGNQFLAQIRNCHLILEVVRNFEDLNVPYSQENLNPQRDIEIIKTELLMKDLEVLEKVIEKLEKEIKKEKTLEKKLELLKKIQKELSQGKLISQLDLKEEEKENIKEFQFLTAKPIIYVINIDEKTSSKNFFLNDEKKFLRLNLKLEEEISELTSEEKEELKIESQIDQLILKCYNLLELITFYTVVGGKETRAWTIKKGTPCQKAAGIIHSDFEEKFIKAEVIFWEELLKAGSWQRAKERGWLKTVGKDYPIKDGEVIEFKI